MAQELNFGVSIFKWAIDFFYLINFNRNNMGNKASIKYDINLDKYKYLKREDKVYLNRVDVNQLNKRLNITKKSNLQSTIIIIALTSFFLATLIFISIKF